MFSKFNLTAVIILLVLWMSCTDTATSPDDPKDEENPTVFIINPLNNTEWDEGTIITIKATASDNESIAKVEFYIDGKLEFSDDSIEYNYVWNTDNEMGSHTLMAKAYDINNNISNSELIHVKINNDIPQASFTVSPSSGDLTTIFQVDASASSDKEDTASELQVRWDWEADGTWDTDYSATKTAEHQYTTDGMRRILLEVKDSDGQTDTTSQKINVYSANPETVTDIDGNVYHTVKIGDQWWMVENLRVTHYRDGSSIPFVIYNDNWVLQKSGAYCYYDIDTTHIAEYGLLYNFYAVAMDNFAGLAPQGWHVASDDEWKELERFLGMSDEEIDKVLWKGTDEGGELKESGTVHWNYPNKGATNESGFTALPGGCRNGDMTGSGGNFLGLNTAAFFWTSTAYISPNALRRALTNDESRINDTSMKRTWGLSVRCIRD